MSTSNITCKKCRQPVAVKHHSGRIRVCAHVVVTITRQDAWKVRLTCPCGQDVLMDEKRAA